MDSKERSPSSTSGEKSDKAMSGDDPSSHPNYVVGDTGVFWDGFDVPIAGSFNPYMVVWNLSEALKTTKNLVGFLKLFYFCDDDPVRDDMREEYNEARFFIETGYSGGDDQVCKDARAKSMIANALRWAVDTRACRVDEPANIVIVSDSVSDQQEFVGLLEALKPSNFNLLLVQQQHDEKEKLDHDIPTESFEWLWTSILHGGSSQGVNRSSTCGYGVPADDGSFEPVPWEVVFVFLKIKALDEKIKALDQVEEALDQDKEALESLTSLQLELYDDGSKEVEPEIEALAKSLFGAIELKDIEHGTSKAFEFLYKKAFAEEARKKARAKKKGIAAKAREYYKKEAQVQKAEARAAAARAAKARAKEKALAKAYRATLPPIKLASGVRLGLKVPPHRSELPY